jgi:hypothetical protein
MEEVNRSKHIETDASTIYLNQQKHLHIIIPNDKYNTVAIDVVRIINQRIL